MRSPWEGHGCRRIEDHGPVCPEVEPPLSPRNPTPPAARPLARLCTLPACITHTETHSRSGCSDQRMGNHHLCTGSGKHT